MTRGVLPFLLIVVALAATAEAAHSHRFFQRLYRGEQTQKAEADKEINEQLEVLLTKVFQVAQRSYDGARRADASGCDCVGDNCGCCADFHVFKINGTACTNFTYNPKTQEISLTMTYNDDVLLNKTFSLHNPPPLCAGLPYVATWCTIFYNVTWKPAVGACLRYELHLFGATILKIPFGCYQFPSMRHADGIKPVTMETRHVAKDAGLFRILNRQRARGNNMVGIFQRDRDQL